MSHTPETSPLHPLAAEAVSRLSDFALVRTLVDQLADERNTLGLTPITVGNGALYPAQSGLVTQPYRAGDNDLSYGAGNRLICKTEPASMIAYADLVGLWPDGNNGKGEAALYRVLTDVVPPVTEQVLPFSETVVQSLRRADGRAPYMHNESYWPVKSETQDAVYLRPQSMLGPMLRARPKTTLHVEEVGINELDKERGIRVSFAGPVRAMLDPLHYIRVNDDGVFASPNKPMPLDFDLPADYPQQMSTLDLRVPLDATLRIHRRSGLVVSKNGNPEDEQYDPERYNPRLSNDALYSLAANIVDWQNITDKHIADQYRALAAAFGDTNPSTADLLAQGREAVMTYVQKGLPYQATGCLAVAALLGKLPKQPVDGTPIQKNA